VRKEKVFTYISYNTNTKIWQRTHARNVQRRKLDYIHERRVKERKNRLIEMRAGFIQWRNYQRWDQLGIKDVSR